MANFGEQWDEIMRSHNKELKSAKIDALNAVLGLADRCDVKTADDYKEVVELYMASLGVEL